MVRVKHGATGGTVEVNVGAWVHFKSDVEQAGQLSEVKRNAFGQPILVLKNETGFRGDYIHGNTTTEVNASDCWVE